MATREQTIRKMRDARALWIELDNPPRRALQVKRPPRDVVTSWQGAIKADVSAAPHLRQAASVLVTDWRGFTEADLYGAAVGGGDVAVAFDAEVFADWIEAEDDPAVQFDIVKCAMEQFTAYQDKKAEAAKN